MGRLQRILLLGWLCVRMGLTGVALRRIFRKMLSRVMGKLPKPPERFYKEMTTGEANVTNEDSA